MNLSKLHRLALALIIIIAAALRFVHLETVPVHLSNDEISIAYDSYSVLHTLRDEYGEILPISFRSHNTYKAPLYAYLAIVPIRLLGNTATAVRIPAALLGTLSVALLILLAWLFTRRPGIALGSGFILAISPWHVFVSRTALESGLGFFFILAALIAFIIHLRTHRIWSLLACAMFLALSMYGYHTQWGQAPLLAAFFAAQIFFRSARAIRPVIIFSLAFALFSLPLFLDYRSRLATSARGNTEVLWNASAIRDEFKLAKIPVISGLSRFAATTADNYLKSVSPARLFFTGLNLFPSPHPYNHGLFYPLLLPCPIAGVVTWRRYLCRYSGLFWFWLFSSPLVSALTQGDPNLNRDLVMAAPLGILMAAGANHLLRRWRLLRIVFAAGLVFSVVYFSFVYFRHFPIHSGLNYQYGFRQLAEFLAPRSAQYDRILVDPRFGPYNRFDGVPHLYVAYHTSLSPAALLSRRGLPQGLFFDKFQITSVNWYHLDYTPRTLITVPVSNLPPENLPDIPVRIINTIHYPDGTPAFSVFETAITFESRI